MAQTIAPDRTPVELAELPPADALYQIAGWLDDCDNHLATRRPGGLPTPWFNLLEAFAAVREAAGRAPPATTWAVLQDIKAERRRQVDEEGHTSAHDDGHADGALARAAACYAAGFRIHASNGEDGIRPAWLWPRGWEFNPADRRRELVMAGALIVAEIERLDRAAANAVRDPKFTLSDGRPWWRDDQTTFHVLCLVSEIEPQIPVLPEHEGTILAPLNRGRNARVLTVADIATWSDDECRDAELWAGAIHLSASDNDDIEIPPMPPHLAPWTERKAS